MKRDRTKQREEKILKMIPKNVKTVLDIGSRGDLFEGYDVKTIDAIEEANITQDLNLNQKLPFKDDSFDIVVMNQILEHLNYVGEIIKESKRVSKKYIFVGLPSELTYGMRIKYLFGKIEQPGYRPYGHKHRFGIKEAEDFINKFFGNYKRKEYFGAFFGCSVLPEKIIDFLTKIRPSLFAKEVWYIIKCQ